jgi:hypothetical protein
MAGVLASLPWNDGQVNPSGIKTIVYFALKSWIKTFPKIIALPANPKDFVTMAGDFEMVAGKTFLKLYTTQGKGKLNFEPIGEKDHQMLMNKGTFSFPDISDAAKALAKSVLNSNVVMIVPLPHESEKRYVMLGSEDYDSTVSIKGDSGDKPGSDKGLSFDVEVPDVTPLPNYSGALVLEDGSLDCETGVFTPSAG